MPDALVADLVAERPDLDAGAAVAPLSLHPGPRFRRTAGGVARLGALLEETGFRPLALGRGARLLNATPDLAQVAAVDRGRLVRVGPTGHGFRIPRPDWRLDLPLADSATFLGQDRLLVTSPVSETHGRLGKRYRQNTVHRVLLVDAGTGAILDEVVLDVFAAGAVASAHPVDGSVLLDLGEGQDGSSVHVVRVVDDRLRVTRALEDVVVAGFDPEGTRLLVLPHPGFPGQPRVLSWPDLAVLAVAESQAAGGEEDGFDLYGCFLGHDRILLSTLERGLRVAHADLSGVIPIAFPAEVVGAAPAFGLVMGLSADTISTGLWTGTHELTLVWRLRDPETSAG